MENFFIDDKFYSCIDDYTALESDGDIKEWVNSLPDDWEQEIQYTQEEPIFTLKIDDIMGCLQEMYEGRYPEESERIDKKIKQALTESIDIEKLNSMLPVLFYPSGKKDVLTKQDLIDHL